MTVNLPIRCHACGQEGFATLDQVLAVGACACGSDDIEVEDIEVTAAVPTYDYFNDASILNAFNVHPGGVTPGARCWCGAPATHNFRGQNYCEHHAAGALRTSKKAAWESDQPMNVLRDTQVVTQKARCSNCFHEFQVSATDPAQPLPNCPNCGSVAVSAAGATNTYATAGFKEDFKTVFGDEEEENPWDKVKVPKPKTGTANASGQGYNLHYEALSEGGILSTLVNMVNFARSSGDDKIPDWFKKYFSRLLLPEEIASGRWETGGAGSYAWGTMGAKLDQTTAKVIEISRGIQAANPGIDKRQAAALAEQVITRYPKMVRRTA